MLDGQSAGQILLWWEIATKAGKTCKSRVSAHDAGGKAPGISRGIRQYPLIYNQDLHTGSLLIELGSDKNSLDEARRTLPLLADALARLYAALS